MRKKRANVFHCESLAELASQLLRAPHDHQINHLRRAEKLHDEMLGDPDGSYPLAYVLFRITGMKAMYATTETLFARGITHDLREIIDQLSKSLKLAASPLDRCVNTQTLSKEKNISTRTLARWREDGLRWRWGYLEKDSYFQVLFPASAVAAFEKVHGEKVAYAARFSRLSSLELRKLFARATRLAQATGAEPFTLARHFAKRTGRSAETLRLLFLRHDKEDPTHAIFQNYTEPLSDAQKDAIYRAWSSRTKTRVLSQQFKRTRATLYRVINEKRIDAIKPHVRPWHAMRTLARDDAATVFLSTPLEEFIPGTTSKGLADLPKEWRAFFSSLPPTDDAQKRLMLRYNYLKYQLDTQYQALAHTHAQARMVAHLEAACLEAQTCRRAIVRIALPVVHSMANRHLGALPKNLHQTALVRLIALSLPILEEAIDAFDPSGKTTFERYLSNTLLKHYAQLKAENTHTTAEDLVVQVRIVLEKSAGH